MTVSIGCLIPLGGLVFLFVSVFSCIKSCSIMIMAVSVSFSLSVIESCDECSMMWDLRVGVKYSYTNTEIQRVTAARSYRYLPRTRSVRLA